MMSDSEKSSPSPPPRLPQAEATPIALNYASGRPAAQSQPVRIFLSLLAAVPVWFAVGCGAIGVVIGAAMVIGLGAVLIPIVCIAMLFFPALEHAMRVVRRRQVDMVIDALLQAVRMNLPLPAMIAAVQRSERGRFAVRLGRFRELLLGGSSVGQSLGAAFPQASRDVVEVLCRAEAVGQLQPALQRLGEQCRHRVGGDPHREPSLIGPYFLLFGGVFVVVLAMIAVAVLPKYSWILRDFGLKFSDLPWPGSLCMSLLRSTEDIENPIAVLLFAIGVFACLYVGEALWALIPTRALQGPPRSPAMADWLLQFIPLVGRMRRDKALAQVLAFMADCLDAYVPLDQVILQAQQMDLNRPLRRRLAIWGEQMRTGQPLASAMRTAGLPALLTEMLASAQLSGTLPQTLRFLADHYQSRFSRTLIVLQNASVPLVTLFFAVLTFGVWLIILSPMLKILDAATMGWRRHP